jgi:hypothetical protein
MLHLVSLNCRYSHSCLAQFCVRNALEANLPELPVVLSQLTINDPYYPALLRISRLSASAVLFSVYIWNHSYVRRLVADLARLRPAVPILLGGPQAVAMENLPPNCSVFAGEIEGAGKFFFQDLRHRTLKPFYQAETCRSFPSPYQQDDFSVRLRNRQVYYESSRGCPFTCSYCLSSISKGVRHKPLALVKEELRCLIAARPMIVKLVDRTFNDNPERAAAIWEFLIAEGNGVRFHFEIAPDRFTEAMFALLADAPCGLFQFEIGIQSCNPQTLAAVKRRMDVELAAANIGRLAAMDTIHIHADLILGLPFETEESFLASFNQVFSSGPHCIQLGLLKVLPGTEMRARAEEFGLVFCAEPPYEILATRWLAHDDLRKLHEFCECVESFYNNRFFRSVWEHLRRTGEEPSAFFLDLLSVCRQHGFFSLAYTQALMNQMLTGLARQRRDSSLLTGLLRYDWLRCGHRSLPDELTETAQPELRDRLRRTLPQEMAGRFNQRSRTEFLKRAVFLELSAETMTVLGFSGQQAVLAFLPEQTGGVMQFCRVIALI